MTEASVVTRFKVARVRCKPHLRFVSFCGCVVPGCHHHSDLERIVRTIRLQIVRNGRWAPIASVYVAWHHVRRASNSGTAVKPGDDECAGLCATHHLDIHHDGEQTCSARWGIDLMEEAARLAAASRALGILK